MPAAARRLDAHVSSVIVILALGLGCGAPASTATAVGAGDSADAGAKAAPASPDPATIEAGAEAAPTQPAAASAEAPPSPPSGAPAAAPADPSAAAEPPPVAVAAPAAPAPAVALEEDALAVAPVAPVDATLAWREVASPSEPLTLVALDAGILARGAAGHYDLASGALALRAELEAPAGEIFGTWPKDAWVIESRVRTPPRERGADPDEEPAEITELRLMRLRGDKRWVPQEYAGEQRFVEDGQRFRKGHAGGLLVRDGETITRISGGADSPTPRAHPGALVDLVESAKADLYLFFADGDALFALAPCAEEPCEEVAKKLPFGADWTFGESAARQRHSVSIAAEARTGEGSRQLLVHFEAGGWKLEELAEGAASDLWPTRDGGLWVRAGDQLLHRAPDGGWRRIALPAGLTRLSVAISDDLRELWIAGDVDGRPVVYAAGSAAQAPSAG